MKLDEEEDKNEYIGFHEFIVEKVKELGEVEEIPVLSEKILILFWTLSKKLGLPTNIFSLDFLIGVFCRINMESTQITLFYLIYEKAFESPFQN